MEQKRRKDYTAIDLIKGAKRENNNKRPYLLVNPLQGKHIPVRPGDALAMFDLLTEKTESAIKDAEKGVLVIAFAETATAIGAAIACNMQLTGKKVSVISTTRENVDNTDFLYFSEVHSHATSQKLATRGLKEVIETVGTIIFVEDEVTTGNTIKNLLAKIEENYDISDKQIMISSVLNGMEEETEKTFAEDHITLCYILKSNNRMYEKQLKDYKYDGDRKVSKKGSFVPEKIYMKLSADIRTVCNASEYSHVTNDLASKIVEQIGLRGKKKILVLGTEELMYPGLVTAAMLERNEADVFFHATTRSPIMTSSEKDYPLHNRFQLESFYEQKRVTYIYNLKKYDTVIILTDGNNPNGELTLMSALETAGNKNIWLINCGQGENIDEKFL